MPNKDLTVVYYTSNREGPEFEGRVQQTLLEATGDLPLISVSQKPIDFGENICVGDIGASAENILLQIKKGVLAATTRFVATVAADTLFHKSHFDINPQREDIFYLADELYILWTHRPSTFWFKLRSDIGGTVGRKHFLLVIDKIQSQPFEHLSDATEKQWEYEWYHSEVPSVSFKTGKSLHQKSPIRRKKSKAVLPYWGDGKSLVERYCS